MAALSFVPKISRAQHVVVFDIGSATVGVAIARYRREDKPIDVLFTKRVLIQYGEQQDAASLGTYVSKAIIKVAHEALDALANPAFNIGANYSVHAVVHAPWADTQAERAEGILEEETVITRDLLREFTQQHLPYKKIEGRSQFDRHIVRIELNGYTTSQPYKKRASKVAVTILKSSMANEIYDAVLDAFERTFPNTKVHLDAFLYAATQLRELFNDHDAYTIVDVGGEYTSISVVRDETVAGSSWANFGTEYLVRAVMQHEDDARQKAISELTMYFKNTCTPAQCRKIEAAIEKTEQEWVRAFGDACAELSRFHRIPTTTFVSVDKRFSPWFERVVEKLDFGQFSVTGRPLQAEIVSFEHANRKLTFREGTTRDSMLALGILFVDK